MSPSGLPFKIFDSISAWDGLVFFSVIGVSLVSIFVGHRLKEKNVSPTPRNQVVEHLVMGRRLTLPLFVATLVASWYGGIFGVTEIAFNHGIYNFVTQGLFWYFTYIIFALFLVNKVRQHASLTLPELVETMFGARAARVAAVFNFFNVLPVAYMLSLGIFLQMLTGYSLLLSTALGGVFVCGYSIFGGMRADVFSDVVQFFVMCLSVLLVVVFAAAEFGGIDFLQAHLPPSHFSPLGGYSLANTLIWGFIALATLVDPCFYQRCFAAKDTPTARTGIFICTAIWFVFDMCTTLGAMYARAVLPEARANDGYLQFALQILPEGLRGFFLAGIVAIIISTLDSFLLIASHTISYDLFAKKFRFSSLRRHQVTVVAVTLVCIVLSQFFEGSIKQVWKIFGSYSAGCLLLPMLVGYARPGWIGERTFMTATLSSALVITLWRLLPLSGFWAEIDALYIGLLCSALIVTLRFAKRFLL